MYFEDTRPLSWEQLDLKVAGRRIRDVECHVPILFVDFECCGVHCVFGIHATKIGSPTLIPPLVGSDRV